VTGDVSVPEAGTPLFLAFMIPEVFGAKRFNPLFFCIAPTPRCSTRLPPGSQRIYKQRALSPWKACGFSGPRPERSRLAFRPAAERLPAPAHRGSGLRFSLAIEAIGADRTARTSCAAAPAGVPHNPASLQRQSGSFGLECPFLGAWPAGHR